MSIQVEGMVPLFAVFDVPTALTFYRDVLGFQMVNSSKPFTDAKDDFGGVLFRPHGDTILLRAGMGRGVRCYAAMALRDRADGSVLRHAQISVTDPDGYRLRFQRPFELAAAFQSSPTRL